MSLQEIVLKGAEWLDSHYPGWGNKIDLDILDMIDIDFCILGQLSPGQSFDEVLNNHKLTREDAMYLGFNTEEYTFIELQDAWEEYIHKASNYGYIDKESEVVVGDNEKDQAIIDLVA